MDNKLAVLILAAGKGKRLGGQSQKVMRMIGGKPLIIHLLEKIEVLNPHKVILIVGYKKDEVLQYMKGRDVEYATQDIPMGTGHAVMQAAGLLKDYDGDVLILCGDVPFITVNTLKKLVNSHHRDGNSATILTFIAHNPFGYGRIKRNGSGSVESIVEEVNATCEERKINEVNAGVYVFDRKDLFSALEEVKPDNVKGEYYMTDAVEIMSAWNKKIETCTTGRHDECMGINTIEDLKRAEDFLMKEKTQ